MTGIKSCLVDWQAAGCICCERFVLFLPKFIPALERCRHINLDPTTLVLNFMDFLLEPASGSSIAVMLPHL
jgi:hypothetical protein